MVCPPKSITQLIITVEFAVTVAKLKSQGVVVGGATGSVSSGAVPSTTASAMGSTNNSSLLQANRDSVKKNTKYIGLIIIFISSRFGNVLIIGFNIKNKFTVTVQVFHFFDEKLVKFNKNRLRVFFLR
ncbi:hypothetical protein [Mariniflexile sp.]|uniref:hypothetical protein n=1 Tax=Mariniflexile sp. TaxID=1979402 RepID=UPI0040471FFD